MLSDFSHVPLDSSVRGTLHARILESIPYPLSGDLSNPGIEPVSLMSPALAGRFFSAGAAWEALVRSRLAYSFIKDRVYMLC